MPWRPRVRSIVRRLRPAPRLAVETVRNFEEYQRHVRSMTPEYERRRQRELSLVRSGTEAFVVPGFCSVCRRRRGLLVDYQYSYEVVDGTRIPNWREQLVCRGCGLNNRLRATVHVLEQECHVGVRDTLYLTEQTTGLFHWLHSQYRHVIGSEYLGETVPFGTNNAAGLRNETLTALTFGDRSFDAVLSFEVLEHIPNYHDAVSEVLRVLRPGGSFLFTAPFRLNAAQTLVRATVNSDNTITHLLEPEYHGDPLCVNGVLCFQHFGWDLIEDMHKLGFADVVAWLFWSEEFGYLGGEQVIFAAHKSST